MNFRNAKLLQASSSQYMLKAAYSRRNSCNPDQSYKVVGRVKNSAKNDYSNNALTPIPNWELINPRGYRFFLPGNVGPGWHDVEKGPHCLAMQFDLEDTDFKYFAQECPVLLRQSIFELFPGLDFSYTRLTVVSLSQKNMKQISENETEDVTKMFVLAGQDICKKLREAGYWADFINPFSGLPGACAYNVIVDTNDTEKYHNLKFRIIEKQNCRVIEDAKSSRFQGNLFTSAPAHTEVLRKILFP